MNTATTPNSATQSSNGYNIITENLHQRTRRAIYRTLGTCPSRITFSEARQVLTTDLTQIPQIGVTFARGIQRDLMAAIASAHIDAAKDNGILHEFHRRNLKLLVADLSQTTADVVEAALGIRPDELTAALIATTITETDSNITHSNSCQQSESTNELISEMANVIAISTDPEKNVDQLIQKINQARQLPGEAAARFGIAEHLLRMVVATAHQKEAVKLQRVWLAYDLTVEGMSLRQIAERLKISGERVRQLLAKFGVNVRNVKAEQAVNAKEQQRMKCQFVAEIVRSFPGITLNELRGLVDGNDEEFKKLIRPVRHLILDTGEPGIDLTERQQNVITALQAAAAIASPLSANKYDELIRSGKVDGPGKQTAAIVFGSWRQACAAAGVTAHGPGRDHYERVWSDDIATNALAMFLMDTAANGTIEGYSTWSKNRCAPSSALILQRHNGHWRTACTEALHALRQDWANDSVAADLPAIVAAIQTELSPNVPNQAGQVAA